MATELKLGADKGLEATGEVKDIKTETMVLNMGPQHPATHGVLRLVLELDGETVVKCTPDVGYLHTGIEKTAESKTYCKALTLTDRIDYLAPMMNNLCYCLAVEKLLDLEVPPKAQWARVMLAELTRLASHLVWLGTHAMDIGAMSMFMYCFREREKILQIYETCGGQRMMSSYIRFGGLHEDLHPSTDTMVREILDTFPEKINDYERLLTTNRIWLNRTRGVGVISAEDAIAVGLSGPNIRGSGVKWDVRKANPYSSYEKFDFEIPVGQNGDVYDRYLVRLEEMRQSLRIIRQALEGMPEGPVINQHSKHLLPPRDRIFTSMEALIHHFKVVVDGLQPPPGEVYQSTETGKGELGFYIVSDGSEKPYRWRVRAPSFVNVSALPKLVEGRLIADVVANIGSIDIVLGEIDR
jgi:NADH-quinone oxidoreductase subunit D